MLYIRMMLNMVIALYTSRVIIQTLGVSDYGVYGVVAGVVTMFSFFNSAMAGATSRFLSYEIGTGNKSKLKDTFSSALLLHIAIIVLVTLLCETVGVWFLENKLVIPEGRMYAARFVLQLSILTMAFQVLQVPFNAAIISHEKMDFFAYVEIANSVLKLAIVYILLIGDLDKLILYSILTCGVAVLIASIYIIYGINKFEECSLKVVWRKELLKPMLGYSGWEFFGNMSLIAITQGVNMLLNMWFGTVMNAAYDIASRVKSIIMSLSSNVTTAIRPQIVKTYSVSELERMFSLMMLFFCVPLMVEAHYILNLWLGVVPEHAETLLQLSLMWNLVVSMTITMNDVAHATGDVKLVNIAPGTMYLLIVPITYVAFKLGAPYWVPFVLNILAVITSPLYTGLTIKKHMPMFSWRKHVIPDLLRNYMVMFVAIGITYLFSTVVEESFGRLVFSTLISSMLVGSLGYFVILPQNVREKVIGEVKKKIFKR